MHNTRTLYVGEPQLRTSTRDGGVDLARVDEQAGRRPLRLRPALPRRVGAEPRASRSTVVPRADTKLALHVLYRAHEAARPRRLGARRERQRTTSRRGCTSRCATRGRRRSSRRACSGRSSSSAAGSRRDDPRVPAPDAGGAARRAVALPRRLGHQPADGRARAGAARTRRAPGRASGVSVRPLSRASPVKHGASSKAARPAGVGAGRSRAGGAGARPRRPPTRRGARRT